MSRTIRIGIIGSGGIARAHVRAYKNLDNVEIVAVADIVPLSSSAGAFLADSRPSADQQGKQLPNPIRLLIHRVVAKPIKYAT